MNASLIGGTMEMVAITFFNGVISYSTAMVAQNLGAQKTSRCPLVTVQAIFIALCCYPLALALIPPAHIFLNSFGVPELQGKLQIQYFNILVYGCIITMTRHAFACFFIGLGETRTVMIATLLGIATTLFLSYGFTFGKMGLPSLGIHGAPIAVVIGNFAALCFLLSKFFGKEYREKYSTGKCWRLSKRILSTLIKKGIPTGSEMFLNMLAFVSMLLVFESQGLIAATATSIMFNWDLVAFVPLIGLEIGTTSLVGRYIGARDFASANRVIYSGIKLGLIYTGLIILLFIGIPNILVNVFTPHEITPEWPESQALAIKMLRLAAIYVMVEAFLLVYVGALRGAGDTLAIMCISCALHWATVFIVWASFYILGLNVMQTWSVTVFIYTIFPLFLYLRWKNGKWRRAWL
jgi:MATE family multidrug resistance protein